LSTLVPATIDLDLTCSVCGYNLRTIAVDSRCPECGHAVRETLETDRRLNFGDRSRRWLVSVRDGLALWVIAFAMSFVARGLIEADHDPRRPAYEAAAAEVVPWVLTAAGVWLITRTDPHRSLRAGRWARWMIRGVLLIGMAALATWSDFDFNRMEWNRFIAYVMPIAGAGAWVVVAMAFRRAGYGGAAIVFCLIAGILAASGVIDLWLTRDWMTHGSYVLARLACYPLPGAGVPIGLMSVWLDSGGCLIMHGPPMEYVSGGISVAATVTSAAGWLIVTRALRGISNLPIV